MKQLSRQEYEKNSKTPSNIVFYTTDKDLCEIASRHLSENIKENIEVLEKLLHLNDAEIIETNWFIKQKVNYIHNNPVHHGFTNSPSDYPWSSYLTCVSIKPTKLQREQVIGWFDNEANFKMYHDKKLNIIAIEQWLDM